MIKVVYKDLDFSDVRKKYKTSCCRKSVKHSGSDWVCSKCGTFVSYELLFFFDALNEERRRNLRVTKPL